MRGKEAPNKDRPDWRWLGRSLTNYKAMHTAAARVRGNLEAFLKCETLTVARKLAFGVKPGQLPVRK